MRKKNKFIHLLLRIVSGQARSGPPITTTLAQHGINLPEFCKDFNEKSLEITAEEVELDTLVVVNTKTKKYKIKIKGLSVSYLIDIIYEKKSYLSFLDKYKIFLLQCFFNNIQPDNLRFKNFMHGLKARGVLS